MATKNLFSCGDIAPWKTAWRSYSIVFPLFCKKKKKTDLPELDQWFQNVLGASIREQIEESFLKKDELVKLMQWKLMRGKFRPRLTEMVKSNSEELVKTVTKESFKMTTKPEKAIKELCKLKAVGPATASAILTAYCPTHYAFMADEAVQSALTGKIDYTLKYYLKYLETVAKKAETLSKKDDQVWTPHDVEIALWTNKIAQQLDIKLTEDDEAKDEVKLRKRKSDEREGSAKKLKMK